MRIIWNYLKKHLIVDFHPSHYGFIAIFLSVCIFFNYKFDFEDSFLDQQEGLVKFLYFFLTNLVAYLVPVLSYSFFYKQRGIFSTEFWIKSLLALALLSFDRCSFFISELSNSLFHDRVQFWASKVLNNLMGILTMILPFFLVYFKYDYDQKHAYGLSPRQFDTRPYFIMLGIMLPLIVAASFLPSFLHQYPMYESTKAHIQIGVSEWITVAGYEIAYALNFVSIEFLFRGFLVIGMITILGRGAIIPMASVYCFLHFGKPMGEAISSIFGGYILGVIAYETKSIWGGIIVHVGIAWMMELSAYTQKLFASNNQD
jgi:hypothetical protein